MGVRRWFKRVFRNVEEIEVRARDEDGRFVGDDPTTESVNEAYTTKDVPIEKKNS
tara:strand:+ start:51 stop:215 length:165 start_codon:yes stop_codon:yes gene_type:complete